MRARHVFSMMTHAQVEDLVAGYPPLQGVRLYEWRDGGHRWRCLPRPIRNDLARHMRTLKGRPWYR